VKGEKKEQKSKHKTCRICTQKKFAIVRNLKINNEERNVYFSERERERKVELKSEQQCLRQANTHRNVWMNGGKKMKI
jgi:hypothetical protein